MDFVNFWKIVRKHPWIPRILVGAKQILVEQSETTPTLIDHLFGIDAVENEIEYIVFKPWSKLDLAAKHEQLTARDEDNENETAGTLSKHTSHYCYWHRPTKQRPFTNHITNSDMDNLSKSPNTRKNVRQLIETVTEQGGVIDAVVIVQELRIEVQTTSADPLTRIHGLINDNVDVSRFSYIVFLPK
jgi:hypothetical protein